MIFKKQIQTYYTCILFFTISSCILFAQKPSVSDELVQHQASILHVGISKDTPIPKKIFELEKPYGGANIFYTDVESVVCGSKVCKVVPIRLYWDALGKFTAFELKTGVHLEKEDGVLFNEADYNKLHHILKDENSVLKHYYKDELVDKADDNAVDALSGATIDINPNAVVEGAIWTCYTLWHWVNGELPEEVRRITTKKTSTELLKKYLVYGNVYYRNLAIEALKIRQVYDISTIRKILKAANINSKLQSEALKYLEASTASIYYEYIIWFFEFADKPHRLEILNSIRKIDFKASYQFYDALSQQLSKTNNYQEINLIINLLKNQHHNSKISNNEVELLLEHNNFLIARNAYWYLRDKDLNTSQKQKMLQFKNEFKGKL